MQRADWVGYPCISLSWKEIRDLERGEIVRVRNVADSVVTVHTERLLDLVEDSLMIPLSMRCDVLFLVSASDGK